MSKKSIRYFLGGSLLVVITLGIGLRFNIIKLPITNTMHPQYVADFGDDRILMGGYHNVFVGKVIKQVGNTNDRGTPETQFAVDVVYNIKGNLVGSIVVNQEGGYQNGILYLVHGGDVVHPADIGNNQEEDDQLLQVGSTYLFAARYYEQKDWYTITSHPNGRKLISSDSNLDKVTLENLAKNDEKVLKLQEAYKHEILLESDVKNNNTRNSYQSLQEKK